MNRDIVEGGWKQIKGKVHVHWCKLIGDPLGVVSGRHTQYDGERQSSYGAIRSKPLGAAMQTHPARLLSLKRPAGGNPSRTAPFLAVHTHDPH
jgi:uncharacterized protein YjbJ (UPF0337 family)